VGTLASLLPDNLANLPNNVTAPESKEKENDSYPSKEREPPVY
jgi:hypothetical protein